MESPATFECLVTLTYFKMLKKFCFLPVLIFYFVTVTTIQPELGKIMYADYKQVGVDVRSGCLLKLYIMVSYVA